MMTSLIRRTASSLCFNFRNRHFFTHPTNPMEETGLYGCKHLKTPKGFQRLVDEAIERSNELFGNVSGMLSYDEIVNALDEISDIVSQVESLIEFCRQTHPDREFVEEALKASMRIDKYIHNLNTNLTLHNATLKDEVASDPRFNHGNNGIYLSAKKMNRVSQLNIKIAKCSAQFYENIAKVHEYPTSRLPKNLRYIAAPVSTLSNVLQQEYEDKIRQREYIMRNSVPRANLRVLDRLIDARHEISQLMGYKSYADYALRSNMASSSDDVLSFLVRLSETVKPKAAEEFESLRNFKREINGQERLEPWDEAHFTRLMKLSAYNMDLSVIASYFSLTQCIEGLKVIVESLFGMKFLNCPLAPGESWHPDVMKMSLHHPDEGDFGYIYLDLYSRQGKHPRSFKKTLRGWRRVSKTKYQLPVMAIVCNFSKPCNSGVVRLNHYDVETLFHEFGHALHSLFSRTDYYHLAFEISETPSILFEYYAWDYRVLKKFARHYSTGDTIPEKLVDSMVEAKKMFAGMELQEQIFHALVDQKLFGVPSSQKIDTTSIVADLRKQHTNWEHVKGTHCQTRWTQLLENGAKNYGYVNAKCFASTIWERVCKEDPLSLETGIAIRTKFLQHGGAKDPAQLLQDLGGDGILRYQNGGGLVPDITSLCNELNLRNENIETN